MSDLPAPQQLVLKDPDGQASKRRSTEATRLAEVAKAGYSVARCGSFDLIGLAQRASCGRWRRPKRQNSEPLPVDLAAE